MHVHGKKNRQTGDIAIATVDLRQFLLVVQIKAEKKKKPVSFSEEHPSEWLLSMSPWNCLAWKRLKW